MSVQRTVVAPVASGAVRAAGRRENPRNTRPRSVVAACSTGGVHTFGYRSVSRHGASDPLSGSRKRRSSRSMSWISYAFDICAMIRHENGDVNDGIATMPTRHRLPGGGLDG